MKNHRPDSRLFLFHRRKVIGGGALLSPLSLCRGPRPETRGLAGAQKPIPLSLPIPLMINKMRPNGPIDTVQGCSLPRSMSTIEIAVSWRSTCSEHTGPAAPAAFGGAFFPRPPHRLPPPPPGGISPTARRRTSGMPREALRAAGSKQCRWGSHALQRLAPQHVGPYNTAQ